MKAAFTQLIERVSPQAALRRAITLCDENKFGDALPRLRRAADAGLPDAKYRIGLLYTQGSGVPPSVTEAARWLERAADEGHIDAQTTLAALFVNGLVDADQLSEAAFSADRLFSENKPGQPNFASALKWALRAAEAGSAKAQALAGYILTCGPEEMRDVEAARNWYRRSAAAGCPEGSLGYALSLAPRSDDDEGKREVIKHLRHAAEAELPSAIYLLAVLTEQGVGYRLRAQDVDPTIPIGE